MLWGYAYQTAGSNFYPVDMLAKTSKKLVQQHRDVLMHDNEIIFKWKVTKRLKIKEEVSNADRIR